MEIISIALFLVLLGIIILISFKYKNSNDSIVKKVAINILSFVLLFAFYYFIIAIISMIPLGIISSHIKSAEDSGLWALSIMLGIIIAPVLSIVTIIIFNKKKENAQNIEKGDNKTTYQKKKNPIIIVIFLALIAIICIMLVTFKNLNLSTSSMDVFCSFTYYDDMTPGAEYEISIYESQVEIKKTEFCSMVDCEPIIKKEVFEYSNENMDKLKKFINSNNIFIEKYNINLNYNDLNDYQKNIITSITMGEYFFETSIEDYDYKIEYSKNDNLNYSIYLKKDKSILVKKCYINDDYDITKIDTYSLNFSNENLNILNEYILKEAEVKKKNVIYKNSSLKKDEINIFKSIEENNESYLNDYENTPKLLYTISYNGINCLTPTLYLYDDNTYEYYYTQTFSDKPLSPKTGNYDYNISTIINNIDKYDENPAGPYYIKSSDGKTYETYNSNNELIEFINLLGIKMEMCLQTED